MNESKRTPRHFAEELEKPKQKARQLASARESAHV
jgi:hypothetical protein